MDKTPSNKYDIVINEKDFSCEEFKKNLSICMRNSDDNIIYCQSLRDVYESCLRKENKKIK